LFTVQGQGTQATPSSSTIKSRVLLLNLDVKLAPDNNVELNIYDNEDVDSKLKEFARIHNLSDGKLHKLRALVDSTLNDDANK